MTTTGTAAAGPTVSDTPAGPASRSTPEPLLPAYGRSTLADLLPSVGHHLGVPGCDDPQCEADHGYTGALAGDDLTVRMSAAADGPDRVARLVRFSTTLQRAAAV